MSNGLKREVEPDEKESEKNKKVDKAKIEELKKKKKEMQEELDEMRGRTAMGKMACVLVFLLALFIILGSVLAMVKLDIGGIASEVLAPSIGDVPVVRSILPSNLQRKTPAEIQAQAQADSQAQVDSQAQADSQVQVDSQMQAAQNAQTVTNTQADPNQQVTDTQAQTNQNTQTDPNQQVADTQAQTNQNTQTDPNQQVTDTQAQAEADSEAALADYVATYSAMKPKDAAKVFDSMMPDQEDLVVEILQNLKPNQRAAILSKMSVANAAILTEKMKR